MLNDFEREKTPVEKSVNWLAISTIYVAIAITLPLFNVAGDIVLSIGFNKGILALLCSVSFLSLLGAFTGYVGSKTRLSTYMITSSVFGKNIAKFINVLMSIVLLFWFSMTLSYFGQAVQIFTQNIFGFGLSTNLSAILCGIFVLICCIFGFKGLDQVSKYCMPILLLILYAMLFSCLHNTQLKSVLSFVGDNGYSFGKAVTIFIGSFICGVSILPDFARFAKTPTHGIFGGLCGILGAQLLVCLPCIFIAIAYNNGDFINNFIVFSPIIAISVIVLATISTNNANIYCSSLGMAVVLDKFQLTTIILGLGTIGLIFACTNIMEYFLPFMSILSLIFPAVVVINIIDFLLNKSILRNEVDCNKKAVFAWFIGLVFAILSYKNIFSITYVPAIDGAIIAGISYFTVKKIKK